MSQAMTSIDYGQAIAQFSGTEAEQLRRLDAAQKELMPILNAYLAEMEATAMTMRACAR
ncbi:hypothetical protein [Gemmobacter serpentinus]|uniref:hypothetical protein n=1 Tax=Gemmobacter serpentinus TaxID=2652247 RepID=UPI0018657B14|nr:hypothetical protein [Gemmobacter serpentinus]